jgi:hypothetical protein
MITALSFALFNCGVKGKTRWEETFAAYACRPSMATGAMNWFRSVDFDVPLLGLLQLLLVVDPVDPYSTPKNNSSH